MIRFSPKQIKAINIGRRDDWNIFVNEGAIRAGKTIADNEIWLREVRKAASVANLEAMSALYLIAGKSRQAVEDNVIKPLNDFYSLDIRLDTYGTFDFCGVRVICKEHSKENSWEAIHGATLYGAYFNEWSLAKESFTQEAKERCSARFRLFGDTNPDQPEHYLKKDYIDKSGQNGIIALHWNFNDNPRLSDIYKEGIKATTPSGMFTDRKIHGLWVTADGIVYKDFYGEECYINSYDPNAIVKYFCGVDWGYEHYGVIQLWGKTADGVYILCDEVARQHEEIDYWVAVAKAMNSNIRRNVPFFCDDARPEHIQRFLREGIRAYNANKSIISGIETVASKMKQKKLKVVRAKAEHFNNEIYSYVWDKKSGAPVKIKDDSMDCMRYAIHSEATMPHIR